jgi:lipopolysaccharide exporter
VREITPSVAAADGVEGVPGPSSLGHSVTDEQPSLTHRVATGAGWMVLMRLGVRGIGVISTLILARLLVPEDFGLVAIATLVFGVVEAAGQFGFEIALIRDVSSGRDEYDTAWTLTILRGLAFALILVCLAPLVADFFGDPRVKPLVYVLAAAAALDGFKNIGIVDFRKNMQFHREFSFQLWIKVIGLSITIVLAIIYRNYWALVIGTFGSRAGGVLLSYAMSRYRPKFSLSRWRRLLGFSIWILFRNISLYARDNIDKGVVSRILDAASLGIFTVAKELADLPTSELVYPIQAALLPGYARLGNDSAALSDAYIRTFSAVLMIAAPVGIGLALLAEPFVLVLLGERWRAAIPIFQILALHGAMRVSYTSAGAIFLALGKPQILAYLALATILYGTPILIAGTWWYGLSGAAWATVAITAIGAPLTAGFTSRHVGIGLVRMVTAIWRTGFSLVAMCLVVWVLLRYLPMHGLSGYPAMRLVTGAVAGASTYAGLHLGLWKLSGAPRSAEAELFKVAQKVIRRRSSV